MNPHDHAFIRQAIRLAIKGRGQVEPNPAVGCVITQNNQIIGQGFHTRYGLPHAEPEALAACNVSTEKSTVYVTLEPCCHTGKKTPPCAGALIQAKVSRVVVGCLDPNPHVNGQGVAQLLQAGIDVEVLDDPACKQLIAPFYAKTRLKRPYVTLKWVQTRDGALAGPLGARICITNPTSNACTHRLRSRSGALLVGVRTVNLDNPQLTVRKVLQPSSPCTQGEDKGGGVADVPEIHGNYRNAPSQPSPCVQGEEQCRQPLRCVLDPHLQIKPTAQLLHDGGGAILFHLPGQNREFPAGIQKVQIEPDAIKPNHLNLQKVLQHIASANNATHLLVEPGPGLIKAFFSANCVDRVWRYTGSGDFSGLDVPRAPGVGLALVKSIHFGDDLLEEFLNPDSDAFFALEPSADMLLETGG